MAKAVAQQGLKKVSKRLWPGQKSGPFQHQLGRNVCDMVMRQLLQYGSGQVFNRVLRCWCHISTFLCGGMTRMCTDVGAVSASLRMFTYAHTHASGWLSFAQRITHIYEKVLSRLGTFVLHLERRFQPGCVLIFYVFKNKFSLVSGSYCRKGIPDNAIVLQSACQGQQTRQ